VDRDAGVLVRIGPTLSGDGVGPGRRGSGVDVAVLQDHSCIAENEVNSSVNVTLAIELAI